MPEFLRRLKANVRDCCCCLSTSVSFRFLLPVGVGISLCCLLTFVVTYLIFQSTSELPAISQTGINVPGRYLLTGVLIIIGFLFCLMSPILGVVQKRNIVRANAGRDKPLKCCCLNLLCVHMVSCIALVTAGVGLATLGLFPVQEPGTDVKVWGYLITFLHLAGAIVFFASFYAHMVLQTCLVFRYNVKRKCWNWFKLVLVILVTVWWLVAPLLYFLILLWSCNINDLAQDVAEHPESRKETSCTAYNLMNVAFAALDQYALILTVVAFVASYWLEFRDVSVSLDLGDRSVRFGDEPTVETEEQDGRGFMPLSDDEMDEDELFDDKPKEIVDEDARADVEAEGGEDVELEETA